MREIAVPLKMIWVGEHAVCFDKKAVGQVLPNLQLKINFSGDYRSDNPEWLGEKIEEFWGLCERDLRSFDRDKLPTFSVDSDAPFASGLGTSAALAVALAQLVASIVTPSEHLQLRDIIAEMEAGAHGAPSGIDQYLVCQGDGLHVYQNGEGRIILKAFPYPFVILNSGGQSTTADMVGMIKGRWDNERPKVFNQIRKLGRLSYDFVRYVREGQYGPIYNCLSEAQNLLVELGVVTEKVQEFVKHLRTFKIMTKVTGAGGMDGGSGALIVCYQRADQYNQVRRLADQYGFDLVYKASHSEYGYS